MKTCFNCDNLGAAEFVAAGIALARAKRSTDKYCTIGHHPKPGKTYCDQWENATYDPMDGAEEEGGDDEGEVSFR